MGLIRERFFSLFSLCSKSDEKGVYNIIPGMGIAQNDVMAACRKVFLMIAYIALLSALLRLID